MQRTFAAFIFGIALSACSPLKQSREFPKKEETALRSPATLAEPNNRIETWLEQIKTPAREKSHPARNCKNSCAGSFLENLRKNNLEAFKEENKFHLEAIQRASGEFTDDRSPDFFCIHEIPEKTDDEFFSAFRHKTLPIIFISFNKSIHQDLMMDRMVTFAAYHQRKLKNIETHRYENDDGCDIEGRDVALFFEAMKEAHYELTSMERYLLKSLLLSGDLWIEPESGRLLAKNAFSLISSSAESHGSTPAHEMRHAYFTTIKAYRDGVKAIYHSLPKNELKLVKDVLFKVGDHKPELGMETYLTEFGAYFADSETIFAEYKKQIFFREEQKRRVRGISTMLRHLEESVPEMRICNQNDHT